MENPCLKQVPEYRKNSPWIYHIVSLLLLATIVGACKGQPSQKPPIYTQYNMYWQNKFKAQDENPFFADGRSMRYPVEGTVARGFLENDLSLREGINSDGSYVLSNPLEVNRSLLMRGQKVFNVYCTPCHGGLGDGDTPVSLYGFIAASLISDRAREMPDGQIYSAIYNGINTMNSYRNRIDLQDRWAVVAYVRALQLSQNASEQDLRRLNIDPETISSGE